MTASEALSVLKTFTISVLISLLWLGQTSVYVIWAALGGFFLSCLFTDLSEPLFLPLFIALSLVFAFLLVYFSDKQGWRLMKMQWRYFFAKLSMELFIR